MKLSQGLNDALNEQILKELENSLRYLQINSYFEDLQLKNLAKFFKDRSLEEKGHADKFTQHINDRNGGKVSLGEVGQPNIDMSTPQSIGEEYFKFEQDTTNSIEALYDLAFQEKSYIDLPFLLEMLDEQVSEEDESQELCAKLKCVKDLVLFDASFGD